MCLVIDDETLRHRLTTRTTNAFGKHPEELVAALKWNPQMRSIYQRLGGTIVDASLPPAEVADHIIDVTQQLHSFPTSTS